MKFFKYLFFIIFTTFSVQTFAAYSLKYGSKTYPAASTKQLACEAAGPLIYPSSYKSAKVINDYSCQFCFQSGSCNSTELGSFIKVADSCPPKDSPIINYFEVGEKTPLQTCTKNSDGTYCIAKAKSSEPLVLQGGTYLGVQHKSQVTLYSVSETSLSTCSPETSTTSCDALDPYGPCFKVPNDGCTRARDGSINCPQNIEKTPTQDTCNGASYCARPSTGCGSGYVSGSFNGDSLCVKKSLSGDTTQTNDVSYTASNTDGSTTSLRQNADGSTSLKIESKDRLNTSLSQSGPDGKGSTIKTSNGTTTAQSSTTTTTTTSEGSVIVTTTNADGSVTKVTISKDGKNVKTTTTDSNGNTATVDSSQVQSTNGTDLSGVISAINAAKTAIVSAVDKASEGIKSLGDKFDELKDWLMSEPDLDQDSELQVQEEEITGFEQGNHVVFGSYCPFVATTREIPVAPGYSMTFTDDLTFICEWGYKANPYIQLLGHLGALIFLLYGVRSKD